MNKNKCKNYDEEFDCCKWLSDWGRRTLLGGGEQNCPKCGVKFSWYGRADNG